MSELSVAAINSSLTLGVLPGPFPSGLEVLFVAFFEGVRNCLSRGRIVVVSHIPALFVVDKWPSH